MPNKYIRRTRRRRRRRTRRRTRRRRSGNLPGACREQNTRIRDATDW
jgi:hypothetical protein